MSSGTKQPKQITASASARDLMTKPARDFDALLDVKEVAELLKCSERHVYRLADGGQMPPKAKLGALVRWSRQAILDWMANGCKPVRSR